MDHEFSLRIYWEDEDTCEVALQNGLGEPTGPMVYVRDFFENIAPENFVSAAKKRFSVMQEMFPAEAWILNTFITAILESKMNTTEVMFWNNAGRNMTGGARETGLYVILERSK